MHRLLEAFAMFPLGPSHNITSPWNRLASWLRTSVSTIENGVPTCEFSQATNAPQVPLGGPEYLDLASVAKDL